MGWFMMVPHIVEVANFSDIDHEMGRAEGGRHLPCFSRALRVELVLSKMLSFFIKDKAVQT